MSDDSADLSFHDRARTGVHAGYSAMMPDGALRALDKAVRQARTPRVRLAKLAMAIESAEAALASGVLPEQVAAALAEVHRLLLDIRSGILPFAEWREPITSLVRGAMDALQIEPDEDDEDAIWLLMAA